LPNLAEEGEPLRPIPGSPPSLLDPPGGCPFHPRCTFSRGRERCRVERPLLIPVGPAHTSACHFHQELIGIVPGDPAVPGGDTTDPLSAGGAEAEAVR